MLDELFEYGVYALLCILTAEGEKIFVPIGKDIKNAAVITHVREAAEKYPGCKVKLFWHETNKKYFQGAIDYEDVL